MKQKRVNRKFFKKIFYRLASSRSVELDCKFIKTSKNSDLILALDPVEKLYEFLNFGYVSQQS